MAAKAKMKKCFSTKIRVVADLAQTNQCRFERLMNLMIVRLLRTLDRVL